MFHQQIYIEAEKKKCTYFRKVPLWTTCLHVSTPCFLFVDSDTKREAPKVLGIERRCKGFDV